MLELTGNLCDRHRQLNFKVKEAISNNVNFNDIKDAEEQSDIDKIFKIDVAAKSGNIDYIIEILKSGDPLYISRAIKRAWLYNNEFSDIINPDYLHQNVFPFMSIHMRKKFLTTIAKYVTDENRAASFFNYCVGSKLNNVAYKCLISTSESFKMEVLNTNLSHVQNIVLLESDFLKHFVKDSFALADKLLEKSDEGSRPRIFDVIRHLYTVSDVKYLDLMEKYDKLNELNMSCFGLRLSKDIIKKHKDRIRTRTVLYFKVVDNRILLNHSTQEDVKMYAVNLLPHDHFWRYNYCNDYKHVLNLIPSEERFDYVKQIFHTKYPGEKFETDIAFYHTHAYYLMTDAQKEKWALQQIASGLEILGSGKDYLWYKFVNFDIAFKEIKRYIMVTTDKYDRSESLKILVGSAKSQHDLETLLKYFYDRHINEQGYLKDNFIDKVISKHRVYDFNDSCWTAFNKILYNLGVYNTQDSRSGSYYTTEHRIISIFYHIIKRKELPESLISYIDSNWTYDSIRYNVRDLSDEERRNVYEYLLNFFMEKLKGTIQHGQEVDDIKVNRRRYISNILDILVSQNTSKTNCPELVLNQVQLDWEEFKNHLMFHETKQTKESITQYDLMRLLKKDPNIFLEKLSVFQDCIKSISNSSFKVNLLMRKLKVYFSRDIARKCLDFFVSLLETSTESMVIFVSIHSILQLADESLKVTLMEKYEPTVAKIDYATIDKKLLDIQRAICSYVCVSRPPVPLNSVLKYIQGDYIHHCLPIFNSYLAHLPQASCLKFVESLLDTPVSIQKHGLRLAFECFEIDNLMKLVSAVWSKTKNVSLRALLFKGIFEKMLASDDSIRIKFFDILKAFIADFNEDDEKKLFFIVRHRIPREFMGEATEILWQSVRKFPERKLNMKRILSVIRNIESNMDLIRDNVIKDIVDETIDTSFIKHKEAGEKYTREVAALEEVKWVLTAKYLTQIRSDEELDLKLNLTKRVVTLYLDNWNDVLNGDYVVRRWFNSFIENLNDIAYKHDMGCYKYVNILFETVLDMVQKRFPPETVYFVLWKLKFGIATRKVAIKANSSFSGVNDLNEKYKKLREICSGFANEISLIFTDFIDNKLYFSSLLPNISGRVIIPHLDNLKDSVDQYFDEYYEFKLHDLIILLCNDLFKLNRTELYLLIVHILDYDEIDTNFEDEYKTLVIDLKNSNDNEVLCCFYENVYSDLKHRPYFDFTT